ncbi:MAG: histidine phosphatase family protein [Limnobacter sp.]|uniref:histidine phosphatase family protein n=1 Tax=Limnobacter sp. TaxID=2003368 RepID=UPI00391B3D8A
MPAWHPTFSIRPVRLLPACLLPLLAAWSMLDGVRPNAAWETLKQPGVHALMRHATAPGVGDPANFELGRCETQRNLSTQGRQEARQTGEEIRRNKVTFTAVYSSQWCRTQDTAKGLALGPVTELPALNSFFLERDKEAEQTRGLRQFLQGLKAEDKVLMVTHQVNITALTGISPSSGELVLIRMQPDGSVRVMGRVHGFEPR